MRRRLALLIVAGLSACGEERPPAPTTEESARLDEADAMLNEAERKERTPRER